MKTPLNTINGCPVIVRMPAKRTDYPTAHVVIVDNTPRGVTGFVVAYTRPEIAGWMDGELFAVCDFAGDEARALQAALDGFFARVRMAERVQAEEDAPQPLTTADAGCIADCANGHAHRRAKLVDLTKRVLDVDACCRTDAYFAVCWKDLLAPMDDDNNFEDENHVIDVVNDGLLEADTDLFLEMHEGDLMLSLTDQGKAIDAAKQITWHVGEKENGEFYCVARLPETYENDACEFVMHFHGIDVMETDAVLLDDNGNPDAWKCFNDVKEALRDALCFDFDDDKVKNWGEGGVPRAIFQ